MYNQLERILFSKEQLEKRVKELGATLSNDYKDKNPLLVCILKGSTLFYADLVRAMDIHLNFDFMAVSSYGAETRSSGEVKMIKDLDCSIADRHVIIVEDIVDTGFTLKYLTKLLCARKPASLKICTLLNKPSRREVDLTPDYVGFEVGNHFVVGYGLDYDEKFRNLPEIGVLKEEVYK